MTCGKSEGIRTCRSLSASMVHVDPHVRILGPADTLDTFLDHLIQLREVFVAENCVSQCVACSWLRVVLVSVIMSWLLKGNKFTI